MVNSIHVKLLSLVIIFSFSINLKASESDVTTFCGVKLNESKDYVNEYVNNQLNEVNKFFEKKSKLY